MQAARVLVHGRVQGVCFRKYTAEHATRLGLVGWVRNRPDGTVEMVAKGERLDELVGWCESTGSPSSVVKKVDVAECYLEPSLDDFKIRYED